MSAMGTERRPDSEKREAVRLVDVDDRGRTNLGRTVEGGRYRFTQFDDGSVLLEPTVVLTRTEAALLAHPDVAARIDRAVDHPETLVRRRL